MLPWFQWTTVHLGPIPIQVWGFFVALGMAVSLFILSKRVKETTLSKEDILDMALWMIVLGLLFSRIFHVVFYEPSYFLHHPGDVVKVWHGGLSSFGGAFGALVGFFLSLLKIKKKGREVQVLPLADLFAFASLFGWIIGRIGCFMIHDHIGRPCPNCIFSIRMPDGTARLEMALLEIVSLLPLTILFLIQRKKKLRPGWFMSLLFMYYGLLRFILDFFRATDISGADIRYFGLTPGQYSAMIMLAIGLYFIGNRDRK
ncbi:MAG TPA: prolipoprotein diacylglyceryl transferase [Candidatus Kapabacteria bacterium]|nr:prolipoprotein diacylglyceryl transferase [Candidatus Kapabacteria bacterium]